MKSSTNNSSAQRHFIFGYGSLICHQSRAITAPSLASKVAIPVVVEHFARTWSARIRHKKKQKKSWRQRNSTSPQGGKQTGKDNIQGQTAMGIEYAKNKKCSGVLIEVDETELKYFDKREGGYDRVEIDLLHVWGLDAQEKRMNTKQRKQEETGDRKEEGEEQMHEILEYASMKRSIARDLNDSGIDVVQLNHTLDDTSFKVWVYVPKTPIPANRNFPIMQSYVDIILRGCLDYNHKFLTTFLSTTHGWWHHHEESYPSIKIGQNTTNASSSKQEEVKKNDHHYTWIEDRDDPFYVRADSDWSKEKGPLIDKYLQDHVPLAFTKRKALNKILGASEKYEDEFD